MGTLRKYFCIVLTALMCLCASTPIHALAPASRLKDAQVALAEEEILGSLSQTPKKLLQKFEALLKIPGGQATFPAFLVALDKTPKQSANAMLALRLLARQGGAQSVFLQEELDARDAVLSNPPFAKWIEPYSRLTDRWGYKPWRDIYNAITSHALEERGVGRQDPTIPY